MAKIIKVGSQNLTPSKIANPFKTSRSSTTNPFKYSNFEGNTLQFADVFEGFEPKKLNKMRMIASSVTGSMNKMRASIAEPIINFVNRIGCGIASAWDYAKNNNISDVVGFRHISGALSGMNESMSTLGRGISSKLEFLNTDVADIAKGISSKMEFLNTDIADIAKGISSRMEFLNTDVTDIAHDLSGKWSEMISKINTKHHISAETPVSELETLWRNEIALEGAV